MSSLHMLTPTEIIIVYVASSICEGVFLYVAFIQGVPTELEEAAYIDRSIHGQDVFPDYSCRS